MGLRLHIGFLLCALASWPLLGHGETELRVLIDVSGSMKQTDPQNLRQPATRLLQRLLPEGTKAGVWLFGSSVQVLVPYAAVDNPWRQEAETASTRIHSRDQRTDIETALRTVLKDWPLSAAAPQRYVLLLTDGVVDVDKDPLQSQASRDRLLKEILPELRNNKIKLLTVALSANADQELLERLAVDTDGWYELAESAEQLQRNFLRLFEKAAPPDTVPLQDNRFHIDSAIHEMTVLIFRSDQSKPARLIQPDEHAFTAKEAGANVKWTSDGSYDLVTITDPAAGDWRIDAEVDPDNRVMVVTDLKLELGELPSQVVSGQRLHVDTWLSNQGQTIKKQVFLQLVSVLANLQTPAEGTQTSLLQLDNEGHFQTNTEALTDAGSYRLVLRASSDTFVRERSHQLNVVSPIAIQMTAGEEQRKYLLELVAKPTLIDPSSMQVSGQLLDPKNNNKHILISRNANGQWASEIATPMSGDYRLKVIVDGTSPLGDAIHAETAEFILSGAIEHQPSAPHITETEHPADNPVIQIHSEVNWLQVALQLGLVNALVGAAIGGFFWWRRRHRSEIDEFNLLEVTDE